MPLLRVEWLVSFGCTNSSGWPACSAYLLTFRVPPKAIILVTDGQPSRYVYGYQQSSSIKESSEHVFRKC